MDTCHHSVVKVDGSLWTVRCVLCDRLLTVTEWTLPPVNLIVRSDWK